MNNMIGLIAGVLLLVLLPLAFHKHADKDWYKLTLLGATALTVYNQWTIENINEPIGEALGHPAAGYAAHAALFVGVYAGVYALGHMKKGNAGSGNGGPSGPSGPSGDFTPQINA